MTETDRDNAPSRRWPEASAKENQNMNRLPQQAADYIELNDGFRIIAGLGFPPRRISRHAQTIRRFWQGLGFAAAFSMYASFLLFGASL